MHCAMGKLRGNYLHNSICVWFYHKMKIAGSISTESKIVFSFSKSLAFFLNTAAGNHCQTFCLLNSLTKNFLFKYSFSCFKKKKGIAALILSTLFIALKMTLIKTDFKIDSFTKQEIIINSTSSLLVRNEGFVFLDGCG